MSSIIFTTADGSAYKVLSARGLSQLPIWGGNRLIDMDHVRRIRESLNGNIKLLNLNPFRVGVIKQEDNSTRTEIIDGQHRAYILKEHFASPEVEDFQVLVGGKTFNNEDEVILYFKILNNTRAIAWKEDPVLRANKYIEALMKEFNTDKKKPYIRSGKTTRPFLSVDKLRDSMIAKKVVEWSQTSQEYVERVRDLNSQLVNGLRIKPSRRDMEDRAIEYNFALGLDDKFNWV
jgi:hypothetical protein